AELHHSLLTRASLKGANLSKGDFGRSVFEAADLSGATLRLSNIARARFAGATMNGTDLTNAFMYSARFEGTDLSAVKGLTQAQLDVACGDAKTKLPAALKRPASWPCSD
ncbi:MAG: pentapeptide repeat-containing protein, partial [Terriglobales bacterium]